MSELVFLTDEEELCAYSPREMFNEIVDINTMAISLSLIDNAG